MKMLMYSRGLVNLKPFILLVIDKMFTAMMTF